MDRFERMIVDTKKLDLLFKLDDEKVDFSTFEGKADILKI